MSLGPGRIQREILDFLRASERPMSVESMRWSIYERVNKTAFTDNGVLPTKWNTSFARAVESLAAPSRCRLVLQVRLLNGLEECVQHYPGKTLKAQLRSIRLNLLPALLELTKEKNGALPHYGPSQNEEYRVKALPDEKRRELLTRWQNVEPLILPAFSKSANDDLFMLIVKGRSLFQQARISSPWSFASSVERSCASGLLDADAERRLMQFKEAVFPQDVVGALGLKSLVHTFANVHSRGSCSLKQDTIDSLYRLRKPYLESLQGFQPGAVKRRGLCHEAQQSPLLHRLLDQTIFQQFHFVRLAA